MIKALRRGAIECRKQGIDGWGNTMSWAADEIEKLRADRDKTQGILQHGGLVPAEKLRDIQNILNKPPKGQTDDQS